MPDALDQMFAGLGGEANDALLAEASQLRRVGSRRRRTRAVLASAAVVVVVVAGIGAGTVFATGRNGSAPGASATSSATNPGSATPTASTSAGTTVIQPAAPGGPCTPADLATPPTEGGDGSAGHVGVEWTITNRGSRSCTLSGTPVLWGTVGGTLVRLPQRAMDTSAGTTVLAVGGAVVIAFELVNGYGAYPTDSPACAHPATYRDVQVDLGAGNGRYLTGVAVQITCGDALVADWQAVRPAACVTGDFTRTPVVASVPALIGYQITFTTDGVGCWLAERPTLRGTDGNGAAVTFTGEARPTVVLPHGGSATLLLSIPGTANPCTSPVSFGHLRLDSAGVHLNVPGTMNFPCAGADLSGWSGG